jgi:glycosyltransferase involved in cell wall biosynthesis
LSVIIPTHNRRELTLRAVNSILEQHHPRRIEIIVVDDGSTDGLADAIHQRYAANDSVRVITTAREYTNAARNTGFRGLAR